MSNIPSEVIGHLVAGLLARAHGAWLEISGDRLQASGGELIRYGLEELPEDEPPSETVPFLFGLVPPPGDSIRLPLLETPSGKVADVEVFRAGGRDWVVLLETQEREERERIQQRAADLTLERAAQERVIEDYARSLEDKVVALEAAQTALARARDGALAASRAKSTFLARMSHELRTPINHIVGYAEMIQEELEDLEQDELAADAGKVQGAGRELLELLQGVLDLAEIEGGSFEPKSETFAVRPLIDGLIGELRGREGGPDIQFEVDLHDGVESMLGDQQRVAEILRRLLDNAVRFGQGAVRLESRIDPLEDGETVVFRLEDDGPGIAQVDRERIFEAFAQGDESSVQQHNGLGLGLTLARGLARGLGGDVVLLDQVAEGASFEARFPSESS